MSRVIDIPRIAAGLSVALLMTLPAGCQPAPAAPQHLAAVALLVTCDTAGWIVPCGCSTRQAGGLLRRGALVETAAQDAQLVVADCGGAPSGTSAYDVAKFEALLAGELLMGLVAHNLGEAELKLGPVELRRIAAATGAPFVSANALANDTPLAPPLVVVERGGRRLALVGVVSPRYATEPIVVVEPVAAVLRALTAQRGNFDQAVVLAYVPNDELESLARALPEVDLVVGGPTRQSVEPRRVGPVMLAAVTNKGKFVARFDVAAGAAHSQWRGEIIELDNKWPDEPAQVANLARFRAVLAERDFTADETSFGPALSGSLPRGYQVAGSASCAECHAADGKAWHASGHAAAWQTLAAGGAQADAYCQQCHTTGFGAPGGFVSKGRSTDRVNVGCESCHGPSLAHAEQPQNHTPLAAREQCFYCHDRENSPRFGFDEYWALIEHGAARAATTSSAPGEVRQ
jgi:hypothetical protein